MENLYYKSKKAIIVNLGKNKCVKYYQHQIRFPYYWCWLYAKEIYKWQQAFFLQIYMYASKITWVINILY